MRTLPSTSPVDRNCRNPSVSGELKQVCPVHGGTVEQNRRAASGHMAAEINSWRMSDL